MSESNCLNCGDPETETYDLLVRGNHHDGVALCAACHDAIQREMTDVV
jgi:predicted CXXCH cytochrome family protein